MQTFFLDVEPIPFYSEKESLTAEEASSLDSLFAFPESLCSHFTKQIVRVTYLEICKVV